jgi:lytic murein transglycosylase
MPRLAALLLALLLALPAAAQDRAALERQFRGWLEGTVWPLAAAQGVSRATFEAHLGGVRPLWDLPDLALPGAPPPQVQRQAEFGSPGDYFRAGVVEAAVEGGRREARRQAAALAAAERRTGVPGPILLAVWGRESAYGAAAIPHDAFAVLATKGLFSRRGDMFTGELVAALRLAEAGLVPPGGLRSSWAGALGQPQFLPSSVLAHATDGDGDGRADIWGSAPDTLASIATYLARAGWVAGRDWGFEVAVPASVSCALEGPDRGRPIAEWEAMGIARVSGRPFPAHERAAEGYLLMPAGRHGPAFVVTPNFYALKAYNTSDLYALFVGHVADRIAHGGGPFAAPWTPPAGLTRGEVAQIQEGLMARGHDTGGADGLAGFRTRRAIGAWQEAAGQAPTCWPERGMAAALR